VTLHKRSRHLVPTAVALVFAALAIALAAQSRAEPADLLFTNGRIVTLDNRSRIASALAVRGDRIVAVGEERAVLEHKGDQTKMIDLAGRTVIPGLQDSHIHFLGLGRDIAWRADLTFARNAEDILKLVDDLKRRTGAKPGEWLLGSRWDQFKYPRMVMRWELDEIAPANPVRLSRVYRGVLVNSVVLRMMGIEDDQPNTWPAWWLKDPPDFTFEDKIVRAKRTIVVDGRRQELEIPTGVFLGQKAPALLTVRPPSGGFADDVDSVKLGVDEMLRLGVTSIVDADSRADYNMRVYQEAYKRGDLRLRVSGVYFGSFYRQPPEKIRELLRPVDRTTPDHDFLRWRGTKFYSDGGVGTRSAWVSEPFAGWEEQEGESNHGYPEVADDTVREQQYRAALANGWDLHTHACGDVAMQQTVRIYKKLIDEIHQQRPGADLRWSVIHAYLPIEPKTAVLADMAKYRIVATPSPVFNWQQGDGFASNIGADRMARLQPVRSYLKAGVVTASGSDYPIATHDPWIGIYALLTRRDQATGRVYSKDETIGVMDALRTYTTHGAYLTYDDKARGSLEPGRLADLAILDLKGLDDLETNPELCFRMRDRVVTTVVGGKIVFQRAQP
jgi:predicted amidohydrolase YtcJ